MSWEEIQKEVVRRLNVQPRGFQDQLAHKLGRSQAQLTHWYTGRRRIPPECLDVVAREVGLELVARPLEPVPSNLESPQFDKRMSPESQRDLRAARLVGEFDAVAVIRENRDRLDFL